MDFEDRFPEIMKNGGFDAIIGNPPYVRIQGFPRKQVKYLTRHYSSATGNCDVYVSFVERSYMLIKSGGRVGYIVPISSSRRITVSACGRIANEFALSQIVDFGANQVFDATTYTCLLFLQKAKNSRFRFAEADANPESINRLKFTSLANRSLTDEPWLFEDEVER